MDESNLAKESRDFRFNKAPASNRYLQLREHREKLRNKYIASGILDDPNAKRSLSAAKLIVGTCTTMCPDFEAEEREYQKGLDKLEMIPGTDKVAKTKAVKTFHRSAAGNDQPLPEDIRTPETLEITMDYLINTILPTDSTMCDVHQFIRDRTRSIRQDFSVQNIRDSRTVRVYERIARYHILSTHMLSEESFFSEAQEMEQLRKTLQSLIEIYDEHRIRNNNDEAVSPNECEIRAYHLITHMRDMDGRRISERLPDALFWSPILQQALKLARLAQCSNSLIGRNEPPNLDLAQNNFSSFFKEIKSGKTPYLLACIAEYHFVDIRRAACRSLNSSIIYQPGKEYSTEKLTDLLGFDSIRDCMEFCREYSLNVDLSGIGFGQKARKTFVMSEPEIKPRRRKSMNLVETKRNGLRNEDIVNNSNPGLSLPKASFSSISGFSFTNPNPSSSQNINTNFNPKHKMAIQKQPTSIIQNIQPKTEPKDELNMKNKIKQSFMLMNTKPETTTTPETSVATGDTINNFSFKIDSDNQVPTKKPNPLTFAPALSTNLKIPSSINCTKAETAADINKTALLNKTVERKTPAQISSNTSFFLNETKNDLKPFQFNSVKTESFTQPTVINKPISQLLFTKPSIAEQNNYPPPNNPLIYSAKEIKLIQQPRSDKTIFTDELPETLLNLVPQPSFDVKWRQAREKISFTDLTNKLYNSIINDMVFDLVSDVFFRAKSTEEQVDSLAAEIVESLIDDFLYSSIYQMNSRILTNEKATTQRMDALKIRVTKVWRRRLQSVLSERTKIQKQKSLLSKILSVKKAGNSQDYTVSTSTTPKSFLYTNQYSNYSYESYKAQNILNVSTLPNDSYGSYNQHENSYYPAQKISGNSLDVKLNSSTSLGDTLSSVLHSMLFSDNKLNASYGKRLSKKSLFIINISLWSSDSAKPILRWFWLQVQENLKGFDSTGTFKGVASYRTGNIQMNIYEGKNFKKNKQTLEGIPDAHLVFLDYPNDYESINYWGEFNSLLDEITHFSKLGCTPSTFKTDLLEPPIVHVCLRAPKLSTNETLPDISGLFFKFGLQYKISTNLISSVKIDYFELSSPEIQLTQSLGWLLPLLTVKCYKESINVVDAINRVFALYENTTSKLKHNIPSITQSSDKIADLSHYDLLNCLSSVINICFSFDSLLVNLICEEYHSNASSTIKLPLIGATENKKTIKDLLLNYCTNSEVELFIKPPNGYGLSLLPEFNILELPEIQYPDFFVAIADVIASRAKEKVIFLSDPQDRVSSKRYLMVKNQLAYETDTAALEILSKIPNWQHSTPQRVLPAKTSLPVSNNRKRSLGTYIASLEQTTPENHNELMHNTKLSSKALLNDPQAKPIGNDCKHKPAIKSSEASRRASQFSSLFKAISDASSLLSETGNK